MNFDSLPDDFFVTSHQFTKTAYRDVYPSIDPSSSNKMLSQAGKVIVITGASKGIGRYVNDDLFLSHLSLSLSLPTPPPPPQKLA